MTFRHRALLQGLANMTPRWRKPVKVLALTPRTVILSHVSFLGCKHFLHLTLTITVYIKKDLDTRMVKRVFSCLNVFTDCDLVTTWCQHFERCSVYFSPTCPQVSLHISVCACFSRLNMILTHEQKELPASDLQNQSWNIWASFLPFAPEDFDKCNQETIR